MPNLETAKSVTFVDVETTSLDSTRSAILQIAIITTLTIQKPNCYFKVNYGLFKKIYLIL